jgi:hypothetical protein
MYKDRTQTLWPLSLQSPFEKKMGSTEGPRGLMSEKWNLLEIITAQISRSQVWKFMHLWAIQHSQCGFCCRETQVCKHDWIRAESLGMPATAKSCEPQTWGGWLLRQVSVICHGFLNTRSCVKNESLFRKGAGSSQHDGNSLSNTP